MCCFFAVEWLVPGGPFAPGRRPSRSGLSGIPQRKNEFFLGGVDGAQADQFRDVEPAFIFLDISKPRFRRWMLGNEQLAAVLIWNRGDLISADAARLIDDFLLVHSHQRA